MVIHGFPLNQPSDKSHLNWWQMLIPAVTGRDATLNRSIFQPGVFKMIYLFISISRKGIVLMKWPLTLIDGTPSILSKTTYCWLIWTKSQVYLNSADKDSLQFSTFHLPFLETAPHIVATWTNSDPKKKVAWLRTVGEIPMNFSPKKYKRFLKWTYPQLSSMYRCIFH